MVEITDPPKRVFAILTSDTEPQALVAPTAFNGSTFLLFIRQIPHPRTIKKSSKMLTTNTGRFELSTHTI